MSQSEIPGEQSPDEFKLEWFCVRSQPKHEHIAAAHLRQDLKLDVFLPRIRFKRATKHGQVWVTEALFPNYFFARFNLCSQLRHVHSTRGVGCVVHFGKVWPALDDSVIEELKSRLGNEEVHLLEPELKQGDEVKVMSGPLHGFQAIIERVMPGRQRVAVLLDFLGRKSMVVIERSMVAVEKEGRKIGL